MPAYSQYRIKVESQYPYDAGPYTTPPEQYGSSWENPAVGAWDSRMSCQENNNNGLITSGRGSAYTVAPYPVSTVALVDGYWMNMMDGRTMHTSAPAVAVPPSPSDVPDGGLSEMPSVHLAASPILTPANPQVLLYRLCNLHTSDATDDIPSIRWHASIPSNRYGP